MSKKLNATFFGEWLRLGGATRLPPSPTEVVLPCGHRIARHDLLSIAGRIAAQSRAERKGRAPRSAREQDRDHA